MLFERNPSSVAARNRSVSRTIACMCLALAPAFVGCGGDEEPKLSDSSTYLVEARRAAANGDTEAALKALEASIAAQPTAWAYLERARIYATQGKDAEALADCEALLQLDPANRDVPWLKAELKKAADKRFQGAAAIPPSFKK